MRCSNCGYDNKDDSIKCGRCNSSLTNDFSVPVKAKKSRILIIYVLLSILVIGAVTFYEVRSNSSLDSNDGIYVTKKIVLKENEDYIIKVDEELNGKLGFESTDHAIADVTSEGLIKGKKTGKAVIIIRGEDNKVLKTVNINVVKKSSKIKSDSNTNGIITDNTSNNVNNDNNDINTNTENNNSNVNTENNSNNNTVIENNNSNNNNSNNNNSNQNNNTSNNNENIVKEVLVEDIILDKSDITVFLNDSITINASVVPNNAVNKNLVWNSSDSSIATVTNGLVKGIKVGKANISVKSSNGIEKNCSVEVKEKPSTVVNASSITLSDSSKTISVGNSFNLSYTVSPANTTNKTVTWSSSDTSIATVNNGVVKGVKEGTVTITAKTNNGKTATCSVVVKAKIVDVTKVTISNTSANLVVGGSVSLTATVTPSNATNKTITWTSSNTSVAVVSSTGKVTAKGKGSTTITATSNNGKKATSKVIVQKSGDYIIFPQLADRAQDSTILQSNGKFAMIDTFTYDNCYPLKKYLKDNNITELDFLILTHFHTDHCGCVTSLINGSKVDGETFKVNIKKIYYKTINPNGNWETDLYYYNKIAATGVNMTALMKNSSFNWNNFNIHFYNTQQRLQTTGTSYTSNVESLVVHVKNSYHTALIAGDIQQIPESYTYFLSIANAVGHVEIFKASHHGINFNNPQDVMEVLNPSYVVITNKKDHDATNKFYARIQKSPLNISPSNVFWTVDNTHIFDVTNTKMKIMSCITGVNC